MPDQRTYDKAPDAGQLLGHSVGMDSLGNLIEKTHKSDINNMAGGLRRDIAIDTELFRAQQATLLEGFAASDRSMHRSISDSHITLQGHDRDLGFPDDSQYYPGDHLPSDFGVSADGMAVRKQQFIDDTNRAMKLDAGDNFWAKKQAQGYLKHAQVDDMLFEKEAGARNFEGGDAGHAVDFEENKIKFAYYKAKTEHLRDRHTEYELKHKNMHALRPRKVTGDKARTKQESGHGKGPAQEMARHGEMDYIDFAQVHGIPRRRNDLFSKTITPQEKNFNILSNELKSSMPTFAPPERRNLKLAEATSFPVGQPVPMPDISEAEVNRRYDERAKMAHTSLFVESVEHLKAHAAKLQKQRDQGAAGGHATVGPAPLAVRGRKKPSGIAAGCGIISRDRMIAKDGLGGAGGAAIQALEYADAIRNGQVELDYE